MPEACNEYRTSRGDKAINGSSDAMHRHGGTTRKARHPNRETVTTEVTQTITFN